MYSDVVEDVAPRAVFEGTRPPKGKGSCADAGAQGDPRGPPGAHGRHGPQASSVELSGAAEKGKLWVQSKMEFPTRSAEFAEADCARRYQTPVPGRSICTLMPRRRGRSRSRPVGAAAPPSDCPSRSGSAEKQRLLPGPLLSSGQRGHTEPAFGGRVLALVGGGSRLTGAHRMRRRRIPDMA